MSVLVPIDEARQAIEEAQSVNELKGIRDYAEALRGYIKQRNGSLEEQNRAAEIKLRAERRLGDMLADMDRARRGRPKITQDALILPTLADLEIEDTQAARWQQEARVPEETFEQWIARIVEAGEELTSAGLYQLGKTGDLDAIFSSATAEWYTPAEYLEAARLLMGGIDLDPASCEEANQIVQAAHIYTTADDGLNQDWAGRVFLNPPYGKRDGLSNQGLWAEKLISEYAGGKGPVSEAVLLVNAVPSERWFRPLWEFPICFTDHRIQFRTAGGNGSGGTHSNAFVYLGPQLVRFIRLFSAFGVVVGRLLEEGEQV